MDRAASTGLSRALLCPACDHDHLWLACDFCSCEQHTQIGIYPADSDGPSPT